ncbi:hypothetical protein LOTGIDRAFT_235649 [Lottia gigantea]|uniref:Exocyst complex component Sec6 n=1 Tax=Lottia gigantea TaxID=225164 RepID=V3ZU16_LOTGI|nr:hypothetical protein LOTGIDRAFT_235649 [Lottia gigantea]ESO86075.1 hypothetical protein LOTGIDRAFT_235649 [Lottia gigantea]
MSNYTVDVSNPDDEHGPAPAPLDLGRLESEARAAAAKHVANLLQRPEQLEKCDQYKRRVARKKASVEAMLKTAVQSQLDGVRTGLNQLQSALQDVYEIKESLEQMETTYKGVQPLHKKLKDLKSENNKFCQLAAAQENINHIFTVPESVKRTRDLINDGKLLQAHKHLTDLEMSRDDLLLELHKQPQKSPTDNNTLKNYFTDVNKLSNDLGKQLWIILQRVLLSVRREPTLIVTALRIIEREERLDQAWIKKEASTGFSPPGRPKKWRLQGFKVLEQAIAARIEGSQLEDRQTNNMWLVRHLELTRQLMIDDLKVVKTMLPPLFPPEYDIVNRYLRMYHTALSAHLIDLINQELEGNEIVSLLQWVNAYDSPELLRHPELNIDIKEMELPPLLEAKYIKLLEKQYLENMKKNVGEWTNNSLKTDLKDWYKDGPPETDSEGHYNTSLPFILFQMMEQNLQVAQIINQDLVKKVLELFVDELNTFANDYQNVITIYRDKHQATRGEPKYFVHYMIANTNNCCVFGDYMKELRKRYLKNEYDEEEAEEGSDIRKDRFQQLTETFLTLSRTGATLILEEFFLDLRNSNCFNELLTRNWMNKTDSIDTVCETWADYNSDFQHLRPASFDILVEIGQTKILKEYIRALLGKKLSFKTYDERRNSADKITREGEQLKQLFIKWAPRSETKTWDVLSSIAEILKLKDTSMLSLEVMGLVKSHPDIRSDQLINILLLRGDMKNADAKQMAVDTLNEEDSIKPVKNKGIFWDLSGP